MASLRDTAGLVAAAWCCAAGLTQEPSAVGHLRLSVQEAGLPQPLPCRVHLRDAAGKPVRAPGLPFWHDHFVCGGAVHLDLPPGTYSYAVERGPEYATAGGQVEVVSGASQTDSLTLGRLANLAAEGWWAGDLHVHRPLAELETLMRAEDLHVAPVITWWNGRNPWERNPLPAEPLVMFDQDRFFHQLAGEDERAGGALLFFNLRAPLPLAGAEREFPSPMRFLKAAKQDAAAWADIEKPFWWDVPTWVASGLADSIGLANNHMERGGMLANEAWGRPRDRQRLPDPQGNGFWTQEIYYHLLNCGIRLPPSAGSASGVLPNPVGYNRVYVHLGKELTYARWWQGLRAGRCFVSNGPLLRCRADGQWPGHVFKFDGAKPRRIELSAALDSRDPLARVEIIKDGRVERSIPGDRWKQDPRLGALEFDRSGWFLVRVLADVPGTFRFASTGPFYVEAADRPRISRSSARFFVDWVRERKSRITLTDATQRAEVLEPHVAAEKFWQEKVAQANAE